MWVFIKTLFLGVVLSVLQGCLGSGKPFEINSEVPMQQRSVLFEGGKLNYFFTEGSGNTVVVFIHGTPGEASAFEEYLHSVELQKAASTLISLDRPGWGESVLGSEHSVARLSEQSLMLRHFWAHIDKLYPSQPIILVGHSLGASLSAQLLVDYPEIDGALLLAGGFDPQLSTPRWYNRFAKNSMVNRFIGNSFRKSNKEMLWLQDDLSAVESKFPSINAAITVIQGKKDKLVNPLHFESAQQYWPHAKMIFLEHSGHFLPWQQQTLIEQELLMLIKNKQPR